MTTYEPMDLTGEILADRDPLTGQARLIVHDRYRPGVYRVRDMTEDELGKLAQQCCDLLASAPVTDAMANLYYSEDE